MGRRDGKDDCKPMRQYTGVLRQHSLSPRLLVAIFCFGIILYFYRSISVASNAEELTTILSHTQDSVVKDPNRRIFMSLMLFLQAGTGLSFIIVSFAITMYQNRSFIQRLNRRVQTYQKRRNKEMGKHRVERQEDTLSEEVFVNRLVQIHPSLTPHDLILCTLLRKNYSSKEIAKELNITSASVNTARYRLRKKLAMDKKADLNIYLRKIT